MIFNFRLDSKDYSMELSPELQVAIARNLINLHKDYCKANPNENIDLEAYLSLVEKSPHPENEAPIADGDDDGDYVDEDVLLLGEVIKRKDVMIDALLEALGKVK